MMIIAVYHNPVRVAGDPQRQYPLMPSVEHVMGDSSSLRPHTLQNRCCRAV